MWSFAHVRNVHDVWISALVRLVHLLHTVTQCGATFCGGYWWITSDRHHPDASSWRCHPIYIPLPILLSRPLQFHFVSVFSSCLLSHKVFTVTMEFSYVVAHEWNDNILILFICNSVLFNQYIFPETLLLQRTYILISARKMWYCFLESKYSNISNAIVAVSFLEFLQINSKGIYIT